VLQRRPARDASKENVTLGGTLPQKKMLPDDFPQFANLSVNAGP
jgi:hypothetical protein